MNESHLSKSAWDKHYTRSKSKLHFPDENLVRILSRLPQKGRALDFGSGSGRHSIYLDSLGWETHSLDFSEAALNQWTDFPPTIQGKIHNAPPYPYPDDSFQLVLSWGVFHYNPPKTVARIVKDIFRILEPGGFLVGSIRSDQDSFLNVKNNQAHLADIEGSFVDLYSLSKLEDLLRGFHSVQIGYTERSPLGQLDQRICHWIFQAQKP